MLTLNVPFNEKDKVKALGAKWDTELKKWYVQEKEDYPKFAKWILNEGFAVVCDSLYIVEGRKRCFRCGRETRVVGFAIENFFEFENEGGGQIAYSYRCGEIIIVGPIYPIPDQVLRYIQSKYNYKFRRSATTGEEHISNCCDNCDVLQGDFYLFQEPDSPFFVDSVRKAEELRAYRINLNHDIIIKADIGYGYGGVSLENHLKYDVLDIDV